MILVGIDYYNCSLCTEIFADAAGYGYCGECEGMLCSYCAEEMCEKYGEYEEGTEKYNWYGSECAKSCKKCSGEVIDEREFRAFIISITGKSEEQLEEEFRKMKASGK